VKLPHLEEAIEIGVELERVGSQIARGQVPDAIDVVKVLSAALVAFTDDVEELRPYLSAASRARQDFLLDVAARAQLGPRPR
jgi:hypothetical protein